MTAATTSSLPCIHHADTLNGTGFEKYGKVICPPSQGGSDMRASKPVNQGTAVKLMDLAEIKNLYPPAETSTTNVHIYVSSPTTLKQNALPFDVKVLERHRYTTQMFLPMAPGGPGPNNDGSEGYLVIVALNGSGRWKFCSPSDDRPDLSTLKGYWASPSQGISYHPGVWHHPLIAMGTSPTIFACVVNECSSNSPLDLDEVYYDATLAAQYAA